MKAKLFTVLLSVLVAANLAGCGKVQKVDEKKDLTPVNVSIVQKSEIDRIEVYTGRIKPAQQVDVTSKSFGEVEKVFFDVGDRVNEGDILFVMDKKSVENNIEALKNQIQSQLNQSGASLDSSRVQYEDAKKNYDKMVKLFEEGAISKQQLEQAELAYNQAQIAYQSSQKNFGLVTGKTPDGNSTSKNSLEAQLEIAKETLEDFEVNSPISGIVAARNIEYGEMANSSLPSFSIVDIDTVYLEVNIPEKYINRISLNQQVSVNIEAVGDKAYNGTITNISPTADEQTYTYAVRIEIANKDGAVKGGMFARAEFAFEGKKSAVVIPRNALELEGNQWYALTVEGDIVKKVYVTIGIDNGKEVEVVSGLQEGQQLIVKGKEYVEDGEQVVITDKYSKKGDE